MLTSIAGRVAKAYIAETRGVYQPSWTIEDVAQQMAAIGDIEDPLILPAVPSGHADHIKYSFEMARQGADAE
jgi:hypothetical protein